MSSSPAHYLRELRGDRWPSRHVYVDTEARQDSSARFVFMLACAILGDAAGDLVAAEGFVTPEDLWRWVDAVSVAGGELRVWTHGLEFDLAVTRARSCLTDLGWAPQRFAMREHGGWWQWRRGDRRLTLCDSQSFLGNASLETVAGDLGITADDRPRLPTVDDPPELWWERCRADVWTLREALRRVFAWYGAEGFGSLQLSGASQGMAAYRRRWMPPRSILVHRNADARAAEREATWAGRCEAWRWGSVAGPLEEWDYELCYPRIAAAGVPVRLCERRGAGGDGYVRLEHGIATTGAPVAPCRTPRGIVYPVGRFVTTLWEPEVELIRRSGGSWLPIAGWTYELAPALTAWADWVTDQATNHPSPLVRRITKQWSRTVIGSFGLRYPEWDVWSEDDPAGDVRAVPYHDGERDSQLLFLGGVVYEQGDMVESENACPQVQSYVWSCARVALWDAMLAAGLEHVAYVDTDSVIVSAAGGERLRGWSGDAGVSDLAKRALPPWSSGDPVRRRPPLRVKGRYDSAEIYGARQIILPRETRVAGLRKDATRTGASSWRADVWEMMPGGLGGPEEARTRRRYFTLRRGELHRDRVVGGATRPIRVVS